jgi:hypothetical protein
MGTAAVDMTVPQSCLGLTTLEKTGVGFIQSAEMHFNELRLALNALELYAAHVPHNAVGYGGPWIENHFISKFEEHVISSSNEISLDLLVPTFLYLSHGPTFG